MHKTLHLYLAAILLSVVVSSHALASRPSRHADFFMNPEQVFRNFVRNFNNDDDLIRGSGFRVLHEEKQVTVSVDVPGIEPKDLEVLFENDSLVVKGKRNCEKSSKTGEYNFYRAILLPSQLDDSKIVAKLKHGVLTVVIPKSKETSARKIVIQE